MVDEHTLTSLTARLAELQEYLAVSTDVATTVSVLGQVINATDLRPGLFADENGLLEARWLIRPRDSVASVIVHVTFGEVVEVYSFDRETENLADDTTWNYDNDLVDKLVTVINRVQKGK